MIWFFTSKNYSYSSGIKRLRRVINSIGLDLRGASPLRHTLIFCQFVESDPKGLGSKYLAGWMLFVGVIKISKIEKMRFSSYFDAFDESISYLASRSYEALEKRIVHEKLFVELGPSLPGDIRSFQKRIRFRKVRQTKMFLKWYLLDYKK